MKKIQNNGNPCIYETDIIIWFVTLVIENAGVNGF